MVENSLLTQLLEYEAYWLKKLNNSFSEDLSYWERFTQFVKTVPDCFERTNQERHVTGSALVLTRNPALNRNRVLLTHHAKLNLWLQLGGHSDGDPNTWNVAKKEAEEESGLTDLTFAATPRLRKMQILDIDIHEIPERKSERAHFHYDVRYLFETSSPESIVVSGESQALKWFALDEVSAVTSERSMLRQIDKARWVLGEDRLPT